MSWLLLAADVLIVLVAAVFISANRKPSAAIAWILAIIFVPVLGLLLFLLIGFPKLPRERRDKQREVCDAVLTRTDGLDRVSHRDEWPPWLVSMVTMNCNLGSLPMVGGNSAELIDNYEGSIKAMADAIDQADTFVHVEFFILVEDEATATFFEALERACKRGVQVRVLSDHVAQFMYPNRKQTIRRFAEMGAEYRPMLPLQPLRGHWRRPDIRNHRKLVVVDGAVGFTGSQNMIIDHYHKKKGIQRGLHWHELMVQLTGPVVRELDAVFVTDWYSETDELLPLDTSPVRPDDDSELVDAQVLPSGPSFDNDNNLKLFAAMIQNARRRISVTSPYYVPDETIQMAMVTAGSRGLDVELFVSEIGDQFMVFHAQRSYYEQLLRAGVKIYLYRAPTILHAKHLSIDDDVAVIGSSNLDIRSLSLHMELSVLVHGAEFTAAMRAVEDDYRSKSRQVVLEDWLRRPTRDRIFDNLMRLTSSLQ
ncbi:MAG: phospholipase D-like domain-containing protein [Propionibacteriaceae bacterium]